MLAENDIFGELPDEAKAEILREMPLRNIQALTMASPAMLRYFRDREMSILKPHLNYLMEHYGNRNAIAAVIMTIRFRHMRERLRGKTVSEVEEGIRPLIESIKGKHSFKHTPYAQDPGLSVLAAVISLIPELIEAFRDWQLVSMELKPCKEGFRCKERNVPLQEIPAAEKWKFIESFFRGSAASVSVGAFELLSMAGTFIV
ncbi:hypothetical protein FGADI_12256 [Fusarium gaditjirri]|uniref:F-box domain-containing protein n=1 Tax=Fusarium gaditjirri TaxID=282569 RepID=A0A8H4SSZ1_9HYPO|nr:hypothetical protein FGADI_12256 [Fusarium gaditjirri]